MKGALKKDPQQRLSFAELSRHRWLEGHTPEILNKEHDYKEYELLALDKEYTLYYFPIYLRAEPIQMLLTHAGVPYEEKIIEFGEWKDQKAHMPNF